MKEVSEQIAEVDVGTEFRTCTECGYGHGFHVSFAALRERDSLKLVLICPNCGARYDIGKVM